MKRIVVCVILAGIFVWFATAWTWTHVERFPDFMTWVILAPVAPGLGVAALAHRLGMNDPDSGKYWLILYGVNLVVWSAVFYGLATIYVRRRERRRNPA